MHSQELLHDLRTGEQQVNQGTATQSNHGTWSQAAQRFSYRQTCGEKYTCMSIHVYVCVYVSRYIYMYICTRLFICLFPYLLIHQCIHIL